MLTKIHQWIEYAALRALLVWSEDTLVKRLNVSAQITQPLKL
jgi:hypothetical protein